MSVGSSGLLRWCAPLIALAATGCGQSPTEPLAVVNNAGACLVKDVTSAAEDLYAHWLERGAPDQPRPDPARIEMYSGYLIVTYPDGRRVFQSSYGNMVLTCDLPPMVEQ